MKVTCFARYPQGNGSVRMKGAGTLYARVCFVYPQHDPNADTGGNMGNYPVVVRVCIADRNASAKRSYDDPRLAGMSFVCWVKQKEFPSYAYISIVLT